MTLANAGDRAIVPNVIPSDPNPVAGAVTHTGSAPLRRPLPTPAQQKQREEFIKDWAGVGAAYKRARLQREKS